MDFEYIEKGLHRVLALVEDCRRDGLSAMERDLILKELRDIYTAVRFGGDAVPTEMPVVTGAEVAAEFAAESEPEAAEAVAEAVAVEVLEVTEVAEVDDAPVSVNPVVEIPVEPSAGESDGVQVETEEPAGEPAVMQAEDGTSAEVLAETAPETSAEAHEAEQHDIIDDVQALLNGGNNSDDEAAQRRKMILLSLYGDADSEPSAPGSAAENAQREEPLADTAESGDSIENAAPQPAPTVFAAAEESSAAEHSVLADAVSGGDVHVLGETINAGVQTLADTLAPSENAADAVRNGAIDDLRSAIGLNDRFLMIRDLFNDSTEAFDVAVARLDSFESLDDCLVHIVETYDWNPHCEGAKLMMSLIERRYGGRR